MRPARAKSCAVHALRGAAAGVLNPSVRQRNLVLSCIDARASGQRYQTMIKDISPSTQALGFWSAVLATALSIAYDLGQIAEWLGWLGSRGGPESSSTPLGFVVLLTPSLFLGSSFLVLVVCIHEVATPDRGIWSHMAVAFTTAYAVLTSRNYYVLLTFRLIRNGG
jgi:hypothetical protein